MAKNEQQDSGSSSARSERFVDGILRRCQDDKGFAARLRRADNPATEYQSWEILASFGVDISRDYQRLPFATVGAAIARSKAAENGSIGLGEAVAACYDDGNESSQAKARIRRILACHDIEEVCRVLRPVLSLIASRVDVPVDYKLLLRQLLGFKWNRRRVQLQWAQNFYSRSFAKGISEEDGA